MYRVYVLEQRKGGTYPVPGTRTETTSRAVALAAWSELYTREFDFTHLLLLTQKGVKLAVHRFGSQPGDLSYHPPEPPTIP